MTAIAGHPAASRRAIAVVIPSWSSRDELAACLASVLAQRAPGDEVVVVDNASEDGAAAMVAAEFPTVRLITNSANLGFGRACNAGIRATTSPWVFLLNQDATLLAGCLEALRSAAGAAPERVAMLQTCMLLRSPQGRINSTGVVLGANGCANDRDWFEPASAPSAPEVFCATGGAALYRRQALDDVALADGPFDPAYFLYYEDVDLGWRLRLAGWSARYEGSARVEHGRASTAGRHGRERLDVLFRGNRARTLLKNASPGLLLRTAPRSLLDALVVTWTLGPAALPRLARGVASALAARPSSVVRSPRRDVERRWIGRAD